MIVAAEQGEEVVIARNGQPVAKLIKYTPPKVQPPGISKNQIAYSDDWDSPETNAEIELLLTANDNASAT
ncbi:antitoxin [Bathymodiolus japonicus methanotrophic gill symbiont]|nr:antitoxin [Bathymodiolus japonicus methanotrophic gill symbiont]